MTKIKALGSALVATDRFVQPLVQFLTDPVVAPLLGIATFGFGLAKAGAGLVAKTAASLDTNILIGASEKGGISALKSTLKEGNFKPSVSPQAAKEFLEGGHEKGTGECHEEDWSQIGPSR